VHRPRGAGAVLTDRPPPLPQAWVPRVLNGAIGLFFLVVLAPVVATWPDRPTALKVTIVAFGTPFLLVALLCLTSAARPGSVGRGLRRLRSR
jgi:hypothetical protein